LIYVAQKQETRKYPYRAEDENKLIQQCCASTHNMLYKLC